MLSVTYTMTRADFEAFSEHLVRRRYRHFYPLVRRGAPLLLLFLAALLLVLLFAQWKWGGLTFVRGVAGLGGALFAVVASFAWPLWTTFNWSQMRRAPGHGQVSTLELRDEGAHVRTATGEATLSWKDIRSVERSPHHQYLFLDSKRALVVPDGAFRSPDEAAHFVRFTQEQWQLAHPAPDSAPIASPD